MEQEVWKTIIGFEKAKISNFGNVLGAHGKLRKLKNIYTNGNRNLQPYKNVRLSLKHSGEYVHRLVAKHFLDNPNNYKEVNHIDRNKHNNHVSNLEWCDRLHNVKHQRETQKLINN